MKKIIAVVLAALSVASAYSVQIRSKNDNERYDRKEELHQRLIKAEKKAIEKQANNKTKSDFEIQCEKADSEIIEKSKSIPLSNESNCCSWTRGESTNDCTVTVNVGRIVEGFAGRQLFRNLTFDKDGRLKRISGIILGTDNCSGPGDNPSNLKIR